VAPYTLLGMGTRNDRDTRELDREALARLAQQTEPDSAIPAEQEEVVSSSRTVTLHDPLTMALLAEVARGSRTRDFDAVPVPEEAIDEDKPELAHPHLKKR
jgi:hypothetical protein